MARGSEGHVYDFDSYVKTLRTYQPNALIFADVGLPAIRRHPLGGQ